LPRLSAQATDTRMDLRLPFVLTGVASRKRGYPRRP
jgi:hypothetical protein